MTKTFTITFGDVAENHAGMEKIGEEAKSGFSYDDLTKFKTFFDDRKIETELYHLNDLLKSNSKLDKKEIDKVEDAYVLVARKALVSLLDNDPESVNAFYDEQDELEKDTKAKMRGRVVNKQARHNLCFADFSQEADFEEGKGTIVNFLDVPYLCMLRLSILELTGLELFAEGNYYYDISKCGIGYHGDGERKIVIGIRVGDDMPLHYRWYHRSEVVSPTIKLMLGQGDVYFMSDKATGNDWKKSSKYTLRHAAGSKKFLDEKNDLNISSSSSSKIKENKEEDECIEVKVIENVPGLFYVPDILDEEESKYVTDFLNEKGVWKSVTDSDDSRKVQHYGYKYDYKTRNIFEKIEEIPNELKGLRVKLRMILNLLEIESGKFNQCIVNKYEQGQGIGAHIDVKQYGPVIGCFTLGNGAIMRFKNKEGGRVDFYVQPNSLYIMSGDARYKWTHEMPATKTDLLDGKKVKRGERISVTFRHVS